MDRRIHNWLMCLALGAIGWAIYGLWRLVVWAFF